MDMLRLMAVVILVVSGLCYLHHGTSFGKLSGISEGQSSPSIEEKVRVEVSVEPTSTAAVTSVKPEPKKSMTVMAKKNEKKSEEEINVHSDVEDSQPIDLEKRALNQDLSIEDLNRIFNPKDK